MRQWEYLWLPIFIGEEAVSSKHVANYYFVGELKFNNVGLDRWELVSVDNSIAYFKRPIPIPSN